MSSVIAIMLSPPESPPNMPISLVVGPLRVRSSRPARVSSDLAPLGAPRRSDGAEKTIQPSALQRAKDTNTECSCFAFSDRLIGNLRADPHGLRPCQLFAVQPAPECLQVFHFNKSSRIAFRT